MAVKPTDLPRWADLAAGDDIVEPVSGKKDVGWDQEEQPASPHHNWLLNRIYQWCEYLSDAAFSGATSFADLVTLTAGATAAANQHLTVSGTGRHKHGDIVLPISAAGGISQIGTGGIPACAPNNTTQGIANLNTGAGLANFGMYFHIDLPVGKRIRSVKATCDRGGGTPGTYDISVTRLVPSTGVDTQIAGPTSSTSGTGIASTTLSSIDHTIAADEMLLCRINAANLVGTLPAIHGVEVTYDHP